MLEELDDASLKSITRFLFHWLLYKPFLSNRISKMFEFLDKIL